MGLTMLSNVGVEDNRVTKEGRISDDLQTISREQHIRAPSVTGIRLLKVVGIPCRVRI